MEIKDWTHKGIKILDIRRLPEFYIFLINSREVGPLMVRDKIFEERIRSFFLKDPGLISRKEILGEEWNMYITKGYYIKVSKGEIQKFYMDPEKYYVSYLEISGDLGSFSTIFKDKESN